MKKSIIYIIFIIIVLAGIAAWFYFKNDSIETTYNLPVGQVTEIQGVVLKNNSSQELDTSESLLIRTDNDQVYRIIYLYGLKECENQIGVASLDKNVSVSVRGVVIEPDTISTCESKGFYINKIE